MCSKNFTLAQREVCLSASLKPGQSDNVIYKRGSEWHGFCSNLGRAGTNAGHVGSWPCQCDGAPVETLDSTSQVNFPGWQYSTLIATQWYGASSHCPCLSLEETHGRSMCETFLDSSSLPLTDGICTFHCNKHSPQVQMLSVNSRNTPKWWVVF